ncbi:hypothetical protein [Streptomyces yanii]|uniref:Uncharacterized protein n=1 Tax=Streptomyces yanii TaxID=78510 RepID=A0ABV5RIY1_9ACTN
MSPSNNLNRRGFMGAAGAAGLTVAAGSALTACGGGAGAGGGAAASEKVKLPNYVPAKVPEADLPGNAKGLDAGYLRYPKDLVPQKGPKPGDGKPITALTETFTTMPPALTATGSAGTAGAGGTSSWRTCATTATRYVSQSSDSRSCRE